MDYSKVSYKRLQPGDEKCFCDLAELFNEVFETQNAVSIDNIQHLLNNPTFICIVAVQNHEAIGGVTAYELLLYDKPESAMYVYDLAVRNIYQRNGIGSGLMFELFSECRKKGIQELFVQTEDADIHAVNFYKKLGGEAFKTHQFNFNPYQMDDKEKN